MAFEDIKNQIMVLEGEVSRETDVITAIITLVQGLTTVNASLLKQLQDALAQSNPTAIKDAVDRLVAANQKVDADTKRIADAVVAGTPVA